MFYEVFIPARDSEEFDTTITVEAGNWMMALKTGLERIGQLGDGIRNVMCDIKDDNSIHVTDGSSRRVFVLKEVSKLQADSSASMDTAPDEPESQKVSLPKTPLPKTTLPKVPLPKVSLPKLGEQSKLDMDAAAITEPMKAITAEHIPPVAKPSLPIPKVAKKEEIELDIPEIPLDDSSLEEKSYTSADGRISIGSATYESLKRDTLNPKILHEARAPSGTRPAIERRANTSSISQNILEDVFLEMQQIHEGMEMEEVIEFVMNISMDKIRAEAGCIMFADISGTELYFAAARGPKADDIMDFRIPMGVGIVGFCVREGVSLAIGDVEKDPRFYKEISEKLGYEIKNLCCVPIQHEGRVYGAIELMNKDEVFDTQEANALTYIGGQMAKYVHDLIMEQEKID